MNVYVDDLITFEYPEDYLLTVGKRGEDDIFEDYFSQDYTLQKGKTAIIISLFDESTLKSLKKQCEHPVKIPDSLRNTSPLGPQETRVTEDYSANGLVGKAYWSMLHSRKDKLLFKRLDLFVTRKTNRLRLVIADKKEFAIDIADALLSKLYFAGEEGYIEKASKGERLELSGSPYHIELSRFAKQDDTEGTKKQFNVEYDGDEIAEEQTLAIKRLAENEELIFEQVINEVFEYYTKAVYPVLQNAGLCTEENEEIFPCLDEPSETARYIELGSVKVLEARENGDVPIVLMFECTWDPEHGMGVRLNGTSVEKVSIQTDLMRDD